MTRRASKPTQDECCDVVAPAANVAVPDDETLAAMAKALAHPARVKILRVLDARQACVTGDVVAELALAQSTVSEHLRILREAGLIQGEIEGPRTRYCISTAGLATLKAGIAAL
ncbi:MAG TPA: metalloregulator ArsR/SmtB family transcription factor [Acidimicrobiales bacterium]|nr:metalloregulator ArsR/SmtB family transcription factor [Acidimicrobiales bacterium]